MSKSTNQALTLLAIAHGGIKSIQAQFNYGPEFEKLLSKADKALTYALTRWPTTGTELKNQAWVIEAIEAWNKPLNEIPPKWNMLVLISVGYQSLSDLAEKLRHKEKLELLHPALDALRALDDDLDPAGKNLDSQMHVGNMLKALYKIIEFEV